jgi:hypothetical protein
VHSNLNLDRLLQGAEMTHANYKKLSLAPIL